MKKKIIVIGAGFTGLTSSILLAHKGFDVTVLEKNSIPGGRARHWKKDGYTFDMGPSWYLMPEVFDRFFEMVGKKRDDYYQLDTVDPLYRVFYSENEKVDLAADLEINRDLFKAFEKDGDAKLDSYLADAETKYRVALDQFLYREYNSLFEFINRDIVKSVFKIDLFNNLHGSVKRFFKDHRAQKILEYAMVFLGSSPYNAPSIYSLMSHVDLKLGVFYPRGGMKAMVEGLEKLALDLGVNMVYESEVTRIRHQGKSVVEIETAKGNWSAEAVLATADTHHVETSLVDKKRQSYSSGYWKSRKVAPSMFIAYMGIKKRLPGLVHHNLFFNPEWNRHFDTIFKKPSWPEDPCFYLCCPSKSDTTVAPKGKENLFLLVPVAPGLEDSDEKRKSYFNYVMKHVEQVTGESILDNIELLRIFSHRDFKEGYNAFKGTALGLSHTLFQTASFRPRFKSRKLDNLYYAGQYTHPGIGVPMTLIAAEIAAGKIEREV
jgi:phytoene desaturase